MSAYMEYCHDDTNVLARWHGGEYIELGYLAAADTGPFNDRGEPSYRAVEAAHRQRVPVARSASWTPVRLVS